MPSFGKFNKAIYAALTALVGVLTVVFGANAVVTLGVVAAVTPFVVAFAPANK